MLDCFGHYALKEEIGIGINGYFAYLILFFITGIQYFMNVYFKNNRMRQVPLCHINFYNPAAR